MVAPSVEELCETVRDATAVVPEGSGTKWEVGGSPVTEGVRVRAPSAEVHHEPGDLTVRVAAGASVDRLDAVLASNGQESALDPCDRRATVGGVLACGLSGVRRLRFGPLRDRVLEVRFVTASGDLAKGGGPTVKNVSGFDIPRLMVGSLGTLGVIVEATLRCTPLAPTSAWFSAPTTDPAALLNAVVRPSAVLWDGTTGWVLVEGHDDDVTELAGRAGLDPVEAPPSRRTARTSDESRCDPRAFARWPTDSDRYPASTGSPRSGSGRCTSPPGASNPFGRRAGSRRVSAVGCSASEGPTSSPMGATCRMRACTGE